MDLIERRIQELEGKLDELAHALRHAVAYRDNDDAPKLVNCMMDNLQQHQDTCYGTPQPKSANARFETVATDHLQIRSIFSSEGGQNPLPQLTGEDGKKPVTFITVIL